MKDGAPLVPLSEYEGPYPQFESVPRAGVLYLKLGTCTLEKAPLRLMGDCIVPLAQIGSAGLLLGGILFCVDDNTDLQPMRLDWQMSMLRRQDVRRHSHQRAF